MSFDAPNRPWHRLNDDEQSPQPPTDNAPWLDLLAVDAISATSQSTGYPSPQFMGFQVGEPGQALSLPSFPHAAEVQPPPFLPNLQLPAASVSGDWRGTPPTSPESLYPHFDHPSYSTNSRMDERSMPMPHAGYHPIGNNPSPPTYPVNSLILSTDTAWGIADGSVCTSPTNVPRELPRDDEFPNWIDWDPLEPPAPSSSHALQTSVGGMLGDSNATSQPSQTTVDTQVHAGNITVLPQRRYRARRSGEMLRVGDEQPPHPTVDFRPHGYPVPSSLKGKTLADLPNRNRRAFPDVLVGQKLSWRFLFDGCIEFGRQFNVMGTEKTQPTVERIMAETGKALRRFKGDEPRFTYPLDRLVVFEIALVSNASVQAQIGVLQGPAY